MDTGEVLPASFLAALQQFISTATASFHLTLGSATTVQITASANSGQVGIGIDGLWRYSSAPVTQAVTGSAGTFDVFVTTGPNSFADSPEPDTDNTVYQFGLAVVTAGGTPSVNGTTLTNYRRVGQVDWSGTAISGLRQFEGNYSSTYPTTATAPYPAIVPSRSIGAASQSAPLATFENSAGTVLFKVPAAALSGSDDTNSFATTAWVQNYVGNQTEGAAGEAWTETYVAGQLTPYATQSYVQTQISSGATLFQTGDLKISAASAPQTGWLLCNGASLSRTTYAALFSVIGTTWGNADGTHFNLPNYQNQTLVGAGTTYALGTSGGAATVTLAQANLPSYALPVSDPTHTHQETMRMSVGLTGAGPDAGVAQIGGNDIAHNYPGGGMGYGGGIAYSGTGISVSSGGSGTPFSILQPYGTVNVFIKI